MWREMHAAIEIRGEHSRAVKSAAERGEREIMVLCFSSEYCPDRGRAINNFGPDLPKTLPASQNAHMIFWKKELQPHGYKVRAPIIDFPAACRARSGCSWAGNKIRTLLDSPEKPCSSKA
jgi:hypothetical protein